MELQCHCPGCDRCSRYPGPEGRGGGRCWQNAQKGSARAVKVGWMTPAECRCAWCQTGQPAGAAGADAATTGAAAAHAGAAPAATEAVPAAATAKAAAAAGGARQSAGDQWAADLIGRVAALEEAVDELRARLQRGSACSSPAEAWTCRETFYLLGDSQAYAGERASVAAPGTNMHTSG